MTAEDRRRIREAIDNRARAERARILEDEDLDVCSGCGCDTDSRTMGCRTCNSRWAKRHDRRRPRVMVSLVPICAGCGCEHALRTPGCRTCYWRHRKRTLRVDPSFRYEERLAERWARHQRRLRTQAA